MIVPVEGARMPCAQGSPTQEIRRRKVLVGTITDHHHGFAFNPKARLKQKKRTRIRLGHRATLDIRSEQHLVKHVCDAERLDLALLDFEIAVGQQSQLQPRLTQASKHLASSSEGAQRWPMRSKRPDQGSDLRRRAGDPQLPQPAVEHVQRPFVPQDVQKNALGFRDTQLACGGNQATLHEISLGVKSVVQVENHRCERSGHQVRRLW